MTCSVEQSMDSLAKADRLRLRRAAEKRALSKKPYREGRAIVAGFFMRPGDVWEGARVSYMLRMPRASGHRLVARAVAATGIDPDSRVRDLSGAQRMALAVFLSPEKFIELAVAA